MAIRREHIQQILGDCMDILRGMPEFNWWMYEAELRKCGYEVNLNRDSMGEVRGYTIKMGNSSYKASELGTDRRLLASRLYRTWMMLHEQRVVPVMESRKPAQSRQDGKSPIITVSPPKKKDEDYVEYPVKPKPKEPLETAVPQSVKHTKQEMFHDSFSMGGRDYDLAIAMSAYHVMRDAVEVADCAAQTANVVLRVAMLLFLNYVDAATTMAETVGGGGGVESDWGRKKDDDDEWWVRRCAYKAAWLCKPMRKSYKR